MRVTNAVEHTNPDEIGEPYMESVAQKLRKVAGGISPSPYLYIYIYIYSCLFMHGISSPGPPFPLIFPVSGMRFLLLLTIFTGVSKYANQVI